MEQDLIVERTPPVLTITIARGKANAIDAATSRRMSNLFEEFRDDPAYRVAILTGAGERFFTAGWDLNAAADGEAFESDYGVGGFGGFPELPGLTKPVIVAVNGMAVGGGFEMAMAAHLVVAADHAEFFLPETRVGIIPDAGSMWLPRLLPRQLAHEILFAGRRLSAAEAARHGLVNRVVPGAEVMGAARELADRVVAAAPLAVGAILELISATDGLSAAAAHAAMRSGDMALYEAMLVSEDAQEGPRAFAEKRSPRWSGR
ncbi:MAG: enoyl-CoA hydratase-related protein [Acidimicrobiia bacterium]